MKKFIILLIFLQLTIIFALSSTPNYDIVQKIAHEELAKVCPQRGFKGVEKQCESSHNVKINKNDLLPVNLGIGWDPVSGSIKLPVLQVTYNDKKTYNKFLVPDQFDLAIQNLLTPTRFTQTYHLPSEFFNNIDITRTKIKGGIFASSQDMYDKIIKYFGSGEQTMTLVQEFHTAFTLVYNTTVNIKKQNLDNSFKRALAYMPENYENNKDIYKLFLNYWGTQVVISGQVGGVAEQITNIKECFYTNAINLNNQAELTMLKQLYAKNYAHVNYTASYLQYSKANIMEIYGGNPTIIDESMWDARLQSFEEYPVFTDVTVISILDFIDNDIIKNNVGKAINDYYTSGKLDMSSVINQWTNTWNSAKSVTSMPTVFGINQEIYLIQQYWRHPLSIINGARNDFTLNTSGENLINICGNAQVNEAQLIACLQYFSDARNIFCKRDTSGYLYASMSPITYPFPWMNSMQYVMGHFRLQVTVGEGQHVKQGSSFVEGIIANPKGSLRFRHYCFTGCNPIVTNTQTANNPWVRTTYGNLVCTCSPF